MDVRCFDACLPRGEPDRRGGSGCLRNRDLSEWPTIRPRSGHSIKMQRVTRDSGRCDDERCGRGFKNSGGLDRRGYLNDNWTLTGFANAASLTPMARMAETSAGGLTSRSKLQHNLVHSDQVSSSRPCFSTIARSLSAVPLGCFAPVSHFSIVDSLVFRYRAKTG